jgi:hypothetical protein
MFEMEIIYNEWFRSIIFYMKFKILTQYGSDPNIVMYRSVTYKIILFN